MESTSLPFVYAESESAKNERGKDRSNYALNILNYLVRAIENTDYEKRKIYTNNLLREIREQTYKWQTGRFIEETKERDTYGTVGESMSLLTGLGVLKELPEFKEGRDYREDFVDVRNGEIIVSFNFRHPDLDTAKRATYRFSADLEIIKKAATTIEKQRQEFVRKERGWKRIGSSIRQLKEMAS